MFGPIHLLRRASALAFVATSTTRTTTTTTTTTLTSRGSVALMKSLVTTTPHNQHPLGHGSRVGYASTTATHMQAAPGPAVQYLLRYEYVDDVLEKRGPHRQGHLELAQKLIAQGRCLSGGPSGPVNMEVPTGALFIFTDVDAAKEFVIDDPYVEHGIVKGHSIEQWNVVVQKE